MSGTVDLRRELRECYSAQRTPVLVQVPELTFLMVDGHGDPNTSPSYTEAVRALYATAYAVRFALKRGPQALDAPVMPLEGLWWVPDMAAFTVEDKSDWDWTMMIALPDVVPAQVLHLGPYNAEGPTIQGLHAFIGEQGYALAGKHHEIYLSDPRRSAPEKLRTILRQPVAAA